MDTVKNRRVAVKKLSDPFQGVVHAQRCYRELKLLTHMTHENVRDAVAHSCDRESSL